jgi:hypothetical protein
MTPSELIDRYLVLKDVGTPDQPRHKLVLQWPFANGPIECLDLGEATSLVNKREMVKQFLLDLLEAAHTELKSLPDPKTVYERLLEGEPKLQERPSRPDVGYSRVLAERPTQHFDALRKGQRYALPDGTKIELTGAYYEQGAYAHCTGAYDARNIESGRPMRVSGEALAKAKLIQ